VRRLGVLVLVVCAAAVVAACGRGESRAQEAAVATVPCAGTVAVMAPYGGIGGKDSVQMNWARVALDTFNVEHGTDFSFLPENIDLSTSQARAAAQRIVENPDVVGVVGPQTSAAAAAIGPIFAAGGLAFVSPSATRTSLTNGDLPGFYRVVPNDAVQGPTIAAFVADRLNGRSALVLDQQEAYSLPLAESVATGLRERGVRVKRAGSQVGQEDYADKIALIDDTVDTVVLSFVQAADAQRFAEQMKAAGKDVDIVGGDSLFVLGDFDVRGAYVSTYAPDSTMTEEGRDLLRIYQTIFGEFAPYGGPAYVAMEVVLEAAQRSCRDGVATREGVMAALPSVALEDSLLGTPVAFDENGDIVDGRFNVYRIDGRGYTLVQ